MPTDTPQGFDPRVPSQPITVTGTLNVAPSPTPAATRTRASTGTIGLGPNTSGSVTVTFSPTFTRAVIIAVRAAINGFVFRTQTDSAFLLQLYEASSSSSSIIAHFSGAAPGLLRLAETYNPGIPIQSTTLVLVCSNQSLVITATFGARVDALVEA